MAKKIKRDIKYVNKSFSEFREALINYAKTYFPDVYSDFNESSPGMMFFELMAYLGDVMSFYSDVQLQESFLLSADEFINLYNLAQSHGYEAKTVVPASVDLDVYQLIPAIGEGLNTRPDYRYALVIEPYMICKADNDTTFYTVEPIDFRFSSSFDPTEVTVHSITNDNQIEYYLLKKRVKAVSGQIITREYSFGEPKRYDKIVLPETNVTDIIDVYDSDNNKWYKVPFLAQDMVAEEIPNVYYNAPELSVYRSSAPYLLCYKQVERRFVTRLRKDNRYEIQFGAGLSSEADEEIVPNPFNVAIGLDYFQRSIDVSIDPMNFLHTKTYGTAPSNTTLTVRYAISNGLSDNVPANTITEIISSNIRVLEDDVDESVLNTIKMSLAVNNPEPAYGGLDRKPIDAIREEAMANFAAQNRAVTKEDYIVRCFSMPARFGSVAKVYVEQDIQVHPYNEYKRVENPFALNLYVLSYNDKKQLVPVNDAIKRNLINYLSQYRMMTDAINIKTPYIINIGVRFEIMTMPHTNSNEVLLRCVEKLIEYFDPDKMQINRPILISDLYVLLDKVDGVQTVRSVKIENLYDTNLGYSGNVYDIEGATRDNVIYPSLDPCIFEVRFPKKDIVGRVVDI